MDIGRRIKQVRQNAKMSQASFGEKLGISRDMVANIELGRAVVSEIVIRMLAKEFGIDEVWLRTGHGEMYANTTQEKEADIARLIAELMIAESDDFKKRLISALARLGETEWRVLEKLATDLANKEE